MDDNKIVDLFWARSENAVAEAEKKYARYCHSISFAILRSDEDAEECVNDTFERAWRAIPPARPQNLSAFLGKITRNLSLDRYEKYNAEKRGAGQIPLVLDELAECLPDTDSGENFADELAFKDLLNNFLRSLPAEKRKIFVRRYWYLSSIKEIAADFNLGESKVKMTLLRTRSELKEFLKKEGFEI